ncbi:hypothetical protein EYC84_003536 [Monilinia fructicola]|uniref:Uncharacterized protein n=1 Tax=Monilinia fructicola TaxID=38448 RepID=A0A5M9JZ50_MONFR|nr:hypothetical protein EYC84_003536 [Monilinia fructicola]
MNHHNIIIATTSSSATQLFCSLIIHINANSINTSQSTIHNPHTIAPFPKKGRETKRNETKHQSGRKDTHQIHQPPNQNVAH